MKLQKIFLWAVVFSPLCADAPKSQPQQKPPSRSLDPLESCKEQEKKARIDLTPDEKKQLELLEQKDNKVRALRIVEHIAARPGDYAGARSYLLEVGKERREKILFFALGIVKEWKATAQKACVASMSEETFKKLKQRHDSYESVEETLQSRRSFLLGEASYYEDFEAYVKSWGMEVHQVAYCAAAFMAGIFVGRTLK